MNNTIYDVPEYAFEIITKSTLEEMSKRYVVVAKDVQKAIQKFHDSDMNDYNLNDILDVRLITVMRIIK